MKSTSTRRLALVLTSALAMMLGACVAPEASSKTVDQYTKVYLSPKIDQPGDTPSSAGNAAAAGSAQVYPADTSRTITVQHRAAGSSDPWVNVVSGHPASNGYINFRGWSSEEYRAVASANSTYPAYTSPVQGYDWDLVFQDEFSPGTDWHDQWDIRGTAHANGYNHAVGDERACSQPGDGTLHVSNIKDPDHPGDWLDCHVGTQNSFNTFTTGWVAARVKFQHYSGALSGFWEQGTGGYHPGWAEIDIAERDAGGSRADKIDNTMYCDWTEDGIDNKTEDQVYTSEAQAGIGTDDWWQKYHVVSARTTGSQTQFWVDDVKVYTTSTCANTKTEFLILSLLTRDWTIGGMTGTGRTMFVDWVRAWQ